MKEVQEAGPGTFNGEAKLPFILSESGSHHSPFLMNRGILFALLVVAWSLSVVSIAYCSFIKVKLPALDGEPLFGLFKYDSPTSSSSITNITSSGNYCVRYDDVTFDAVINSAGRSARAFGVLAALLSGLVLFLYMALELVWECAVATIWKLCVVLVSLAFLFQSLTFLALLVEPCKIDGVSCTLGTTGYLSAISAIFLIASAIMMGCVARPPNKPYFPLSGIRDRHSAKLRYVCVSCVAWICRTMCLPS